MTRRSKTGRPEGEPKDDEPTAARASGKRVAAVAVGATAAAIAGVVTARAIRRGRRTAIHVEPEGDRWRLVVQGERAASKSFATKKEAVSAGRDLAHRRAPSELVIHRADGSEQDRHAYDV